MKPHLSQYWLTNEREKDPEQFDQTVKVICGLYAEAATAQERGEHTVGVDEKTGMQALERKHPTRPMKPGQIEKREFEYERHGTQALIATFDVATGKLFGTIDDTRTEADFVAHLEQVVASDPDGKWTFILDQLNTHKSESAVRLVVGQCDMEVDLGVKGKSSSME